MAILPTTFTFQLMDMKKILFLYLFGIQGLFAQTVLHGKIVSDIAEVDGILVANNRTKETTVTANGGLFTIAAKKEDIIIITASFMEGVDVKLNANSFKMNPLAIYVKSKPKELEEIQIRQITAKSLGIIGKDVKEYTQAERQLFTAKGGQKNLYGLNTRVSIDGILNSFSGRTAMLEKRLEIEKMETNAQRMLKLLSEDFFITTLKISKENLNGFLVYISEDIGVTQILNTKNMAALRLKLVEMAFLFKEMKNE